MSETELCKKIRKFGVPTLRKCLFRVNNRPFGRCCATSALPRTTDHRARYKWMNTKFAGLVA